LDMDLSIQTSRRAEGCQQGRKSLRLCWTGVLRIGWFDPVAESSKLSDHSRSTSLLRLFGDGWAVFFVTDSLVQDQPDQSTLSMGNRPSGLIMSEARDRAAIDNLEDTAFGLYCSVGRLVEKAPHVAAAGRRSHEERCFPEGKVAAVGPTSAMICCAESTPSPGTCAAQLLRPVLKSDRPGR